MNLWQAFLRLFTKRETKIVIFSEKELDYMLSLCTFAELKNIAIDEGISLIAYRRQDYINAIKDKLRSEGRIYK